MKKKTCAESLKERETLKALNNVFLSMRKTFASAQHYSCVGFIAKAYNRNIAQHNTVFLCFTSCRNVSLQHYGNAGETYVVTYSIQIAAWLFAKSQS